MNDKQKEFVQSITQNSDGSETRIGDFVIRNDYGSHAYYVGPGGDVVIPDEVGKVDLDFAFENSKNITSLRIPGTVKRLSNSFKFGSKGTIEKLVFEEGLNTIYGGSFFANCKMLKEIVLPRSLEYLGAGAFKKTPWYEQNVEIVDGCHYLGKFLVDSDKTIDHAAVRAGTVMICANAFRGRTELVSASIPDSVHILGQMAFCGCISLEEIQLPESVKIVEDSCFTNCPSLRSFEVLNTNVEFSHNALGSKMSEALYYPDYAYIPIEIPGSGVEKLLFAHCYLTSRERFSPEMQAINDAVVKKNKSKLLELVMETGNLAALRAIAPIALNATNIDSKVEAAQRKGATEVTAFLLDWSGKNISAADQNKQAAKELNRDPMSAAELKKLWGTKKLPDGTLGITSYKGTDENVEIPDCIGKAKITTICRCAFTTKTYLMPGKGPTKEQVEARERIRSVRIPEGVVCIESDAFSGCTALSDVNIPHGVKTIGWGAFSGTALVEDQGRRENGVLYVGEYLICANEDLKGHYTVKDGTICIADQAFYGCDGLTGITIPESVAVIGQRAFGACNGLADINGFIIVNHVLYGYVGTEKTVAIPSGVKYIDSMAYCRDLTEVEMPTGLIAVGDSAFSDCSSLTSVTISETVTSIGESAFYNCRNLQNLSLPNGLKSIGKRAFSRCMSLQSVRIPGSVEHIGEDAFDHITINAPAKSYAKQYAKEHHFPFVAE